jgi:LCP family protein required for cell wall assembly
MQPKKKSWMLKLLGQPLFLITLVLIFLILGKIFAWLRTLTPLKNQDSFSVLSHSQTNLTKGAIVPATLEHPVNILVLGIDNSGHPHKQHYTPEEAFAGNSDTMLLVRLVPQAHQVNVLSIPRDTLVQLPGVGIDKINDANPRGGAKLAAQTVSELLQGVSIDRYIRIDTEGFIRLVDALGGVEVNIPKKMDYTDKTQHLNIHFSPGRQKLNGQHLQEYVRFRHDALGDIGRVQRQQEVLKEILHVLLQPTTIPKIPQILQVVKENVDTDLSVEEMLAVAQALLTSDRRQFHSIMLPGRFSRKDEYRLSYWICNFDATREILSRYFGVETAPIARSDTNLSPPRTLKIAVANATGKPEDGEKVVSFLRGHGFRNTYLTNHEIDTEVDYGRKTQIIVEHGNPDAANAVSSILGIGEVQVASVGDIFSDVTVIVGSDLIEKLSH